LRQTGHHDASRAAANGKRCTHARLRAAGGASARQASLLRFSRTVPQKRLWRFTDADGAEIACELETLTKNRVLLTVKRNGAPVVSETFADKRDALARSVGIYKEMKLGNP
jgi:hypothetical protein